MPLAVLFMALLVLLAALWTWVIVRAGRWGAAIGERHRNESTPNSDRILSIDLSQLRTTSAVDAAPPPGPDADTETCDP
jgi:hypothetical protein